MDLVENVLLLAKITDKIQINHIFFNLPDRLDNPTLVLRNSGKADSLYFAGRDTDNLCYLLVSVVGVCCGIGFRPEKP